MTTQPKATFPVPKFAYGLGILLVCLGTLVTVSAFVNPDTLADGFDTSNAANDQIHLMLAGRLLAMVLILIIALASRSPLLLLAAFIMRFVTELFDAAASFNAGSGMGYGALIIAALEVVAIIQLILFIRKSSSRQWGIGAVASNEAGAK